MRQTLEWFPYFVAVKYIGRPNDFMEVLENKLLMDFDYIIISTYGDGVHLLCPYAVKVFSESNRYIAPVDDIEGNASAFLQSAYFTSFL